jgi:hypothetical protein
VRSWISIASHRSNVPSGYPVAVAAPRRTL